MTLENKKWEDIKADYMQKVEKALSKIKNHRKKEVLDDVSAHLDRRFAELEEDNQTWENFQAIVTEMGPPSDYAELLEPSIPLSIKTSNKKNAFFIAAAAIVIIVFIILLNVLPRKPKSIIPEKLQESRMLEKVRSESNTIIPWERVGDYTFEMSKDDLLEKLGKPKTIFYGEERYTLDNLPRMYYMHFGDISFYILDDSVEGITAHSPFYKFANGVGVGDSEQKIKEAFGNDFHLEETEWKDFLTYTDNGLVFEIHKDNRTVMEINVLKSSVYD
jgi:hypothetical protein